MKVEEKFIPVSFFENFAISDLGNVVHLGTGIEISQWLSTTHNRMKVRFHILGAYADFFIDDLVAQAFLPNWKSGTLVYYKNRNRRDCTVSNLTLDPQYKEENDGCPRRRLRVDNRGKIKNQDR